MWLLNMINEIVTYWIVVCNVVYMFL
uniref:Uncharacterized protein n=1 Tax=Rhizophora mucronata TaxID=61149 RepID=A0A2P2J062_RHIMU